MMSFREAPAISSSVLVRLAVDEYCLCLLPTLPLVCGFFLSEAAAAFPDVVRDFLGTFRCRASA